MATSLKDFVQDLVNDEQKWAQLRIQPQQVLRDSGLSQADQDLLTGGEREDVIQKLRSEGMQISFQLLMVW